MYYNYPWNEDADEKGRRYRSRDYEDFYGYPMGRGFGGGYGRGPGAYCGPGRRYAYGYGMGPGRFFGWCPSYPPTRYW